MTAELVSLVVPVYNAAADLPACLDSIRQQTYLQWEALLVDDGSTDESPAICDRYAALDNRFRVIHQANGGVSKARNQGLERASGSIIGFVDADDWLAPQMVERLVTYLEQHQADLAACAYIEEKATGSQAVIDAPDRQVWSTQESVEHFLTIRFGGNIWNKLFRRQIVGHRFRTDLATGEDTWFLYQAIRQSQRQVYCAEPLYHYRIRPGSVSNATINSRTFDKLIAADLIVADVEQAFPDYQDHARFMAFDKYLAVLNQIICEDDHQAFTGQHKRLEQRLKVLAGQLKAKIGRAHV